MPTAIPMRCRRLSQRPARGEAFGSLCGRLLFEVTGTELRIVCPKCGALNVYDLYELQQVGIQGELDALPIVKEPPRRR
jgi:hypothetical protein